MKQEHTMRRYLATDNKINPLYRKKLFGILLLIIGVFGILIIFHRLAHYIYEYDAQFSPIDYGRAGETTQRLKTRADLPKDPGSSPRTHVTAHNCL